VRLPQYIFVRGVGVAQVETTFVLEEAGRGLLMIRIRPQEGATVQGTVDIKASGDDWRPLMTAAEANRYATLLGSAAFLYPRWMGAPALRQMKKILAKSMDPDDFIDAYLHTVSPGRGKSKSQTALLRDDIRERLETEINLVTEQGQETPFLGNPSYGTRRTKVPDRQILAQLAVLSERAAKPSVQNKKASYKANRSQREMLIYELA